MKTFTKVELHAKQLKHSLANKKANGKVIESIAVWDYVHQGDITLKRLPEVPKEAKLIAKPLRQLAPGTSMGSRHCISIKSMENCKIYEQAINPLCGPVIDSSDVLEIEHPEHGNYCLPAGTYRVTFQRQANPGNDLRRVID